MLAVLVGVWLCCRPGEREQPAARVDAEPTTLAEHNTRVRQRSFDHPQSRSADLSEWHTSAQSYARGPALPCRAAFYCGYELRH